MRRSICSVNSYCENNGISICSANSYCDNNRGDLYVLLTVIVTITGRSICSVNSYCENNGDI